MGDVVTLNERAIAHMAAYQICGDPAELNSAIDIFREAAVAAPQTHPARLVALSNLSGALLLRFETGGQVSDLEEALLTGRPPGLELPMGHYALPGCLTNLAAVLVAHYERGGPATDLDEAIDAGRAASDDSPDPGATSSTLGIALLARYELTGRTSDLDNALAAARAAVAVTSPRHPEYGGRLSNLANVLRTRYEASGQLFDLDEAIEVGKAAVAATTRSRPERLMYESNLAAALWSRHEQSEQKADLEAAIDAAVAAAAGTPPGSPHRVARLSVLALTLRCAAERSGAPTDLDRAVTVARAAVAEAGPTHPELAGHLSNLSIVLRWRSQQADRDPKLRAVDLRQAVQVTRLALATVPDGDQPGRAVDLVTLGDALETQHSASDHRAHLDGALQAWQQAAEMTTAAPAVRIAAACRWGSVARAHGLLTQALDGYTAAVQLLPVVAWHGLQRTSREHQLAAYSRLASAAAEAAIAAGHPERAVELIEQGHAVLWGQQLHLRTDLTLLAERRPQLAHRLNQIRQSLDRDSGRMPRLAAGAEAVDTARIAAARTDLEQRRTLASEWDELIRQVRSMDGFSHFLAATPFDELQMAATCGPVVIVNVAAAGCHALLLTPAASDGGTPPEDGGVGEGPVSLRVIELPLLTQPEAIRRANELLAANRASPPWPSGKWQEVLDDTLDWLWHAVARPVLDSLDLSPAGGETPDARLWWCPTGALTLLPVHAAQVRGGHGNGECVRAWVVSSYTTTLAALLRARPARESAHVRQLVVALPRTPDVPGLAPLPATIREAAVVARHTRKLGSVLSLVGPSATRQLVQDALATHSWLHLACHVATDATDPARTGLALADGTLTIADLAALDLPGTELAVLSACGTAAGATRLLDEAVHVAAAMQLIGYRHVIATLWSIPDLTGQRIADDLYRNLTAIGTFDTDGTARALHRALTTLRRRYPTSPQVWAPFVHFGP